MIQEFKKFIARGNVVDLAVGVIIGAAFGAIVTSLVENILTIIGIVFGGVDFSNLSITIKDEQIMYGAFIQSVFDFFINAICLFIVVKVMNRLNSDIHKLGKKGKEKEEVKVEVVEKPKTEEVLLLEEIRDLLKKEKKGNK